MTLYKKAICSVLYLFDMYDAENSLLIYNPYFLGFFATFPKFPFVPPGNFSSPLKI